MAGFSWECFWQWAHANVKTILKRGAISSMNTIKLELGETTISCIMTVVSNDPSWWPQINWSILFSYFVVAASVVMSYDWVLTLGEEIELIWMKRWSHMTILYLSVRYCGILTAVYVLRGLIVAEYKPIFEEVERILAEASLDEHEAAQTGGGGGLRPRRSRR
ncbi:hypothetical protein F4604DRAFT_276007 [Suillus subluteus]|nr:hypothetical protein F4604DRAFT_276007 [Suillus subluteus]